MKVKTLRNAALIAVISWILLLVISTIAFPYLRVMHDNSTIVELAIGEGLLQLSYDVVYDDPVQSLTNTHFMGASGYGPPTFSKFIEQWDMYLGLDCTIQWPDQHTRSRYYGISLWVLVLGITTTALLVQWLKDSPTLETDDAEPGVDGKTDQVAS